MSQPDPHIWGTAASGSWEAPGAGSVGYPGLPAKCRLAMNVLFSFSLPGVPLPPSSPLKTQSSRLSPPDPHPACRASVQATRSSSLHSHCWDPATWGGGVEGPPIPALGKAEPVVPPQGPARGSVTATGGATQHILSCLKRNCHREEIPEHRPTRMGPVS